MNSKLLVVRFFFQSWSCVEVFLKTLSGLTKNCTLHRLCVAVIHLVCALFVSKKLCRMLVTLLCWLAGKINDA
jgi:hypothetical protein